MSGENVPLLKSLSTYKENTKKRNNYSKQNDEYCMKIWNLFCEIHSLDPITTKYEEAEPDAKFHGIANIFWHTDICDILKIVEKKHFIIRRKTHMMVLK